MKTHKANFANNEMRNERLSDSFYLMNFAWISTIRKDVFFPQIKNNSEQNNRFNWIENRKREREMERDKKTNVTHNANYIIMLFIRNLHTINVLTLPNNFNILFIFVELTNRVFFLSAIHFLSLSLCVCIACVISWVCVSFWFSIEPWQCVYSTAQYLISLHSMWDWMLSFPIAFFLIPMLFSLSCCCFCLYSLLKVIAKKALVYKNIVADV